MTKYFGTNITYTCEVGTAIEDLTGNWTPSIYNLCGYQQENQQLPYFSYNETNPVGACSRKYMFQGN